MKRISLLITTLIFVASCTVEQPKNVTLNWAEAESFPQGISNNAVTAANVEGNWHVFSFLGLEDGKTYADISDFAARLNVEQNEWEEIAGVPDSIGRLASTAQSANGKIYIFGGFTVDENGAERSTAQVFKYDPLSGEYERMADMLLPVEDAVSLLYQDRYIYLISGWNNTNNVSNVQVFDTQTNSWEHATPYPGPPVFGHAGGIVGNTMILADGVQAVIDEGDRIFKMSPGSIKGVIDTENPSVIKWIRIKQHPGQARYRMASIGVESPVEMVLFIGGSTNPYNYSGIGYNKQPSFAEPTVFAYRLDTEEWVELDAQPLPSMDHRGIAKAGDEYFIVGGMVNDQNVTDMVQKFTITLDESN